MISLSKTIVNGITWYRVLAAPVLFFLLVYDQREWFRWMLLLSFFTDLIDGTLARKFKVTSRFGALIDSIGDDLTVLAGTLALAYWHWDFVSARWITLTILFSFYLLQTGSALYRYKKTTGFHTYLAKTAALLQGLFLISIHFLSSPSIAWFYLTCSVTGIQLLEEIILIWMLPIWRSDVKGLYWVIRSGMHRRS